MKSLHGSRNKGLGKRWHQTSQKQHWKTTEHIVRDPKSTHEAAHFNLNFLHRTKTAVLKIWLNCKLAHKTQAMMMSVPVFRSHSTIYVGGLQSSRKSFEV